MKSQYDDGYMRYVGWDNTIAENANYQFLFANERMLTYQNKITQLLEGVSPDGRPIQVPLDKIGHVISQCFETNRPMVGDMYSRYIQPQTVGRDDIALIVDRAINIIVSQIRSEYAMIRTNRGLTVWNSVLGDFNKAGLRAHPPIKLRKGGPEKMQFHMRY